MSLRLSRHARRQMKWRGITEDEVKNVLAHPDKVEDSIGERKNAFKHCGKRSLKVTFVHERDTVVVITAIDKRT